MDSTNDPRSTQASSSTNHDDSLVEVSVVGSPEVFGTQQPASSNESKSSVSPEVGVEPDEDRCNTSMSDQSDRKRPIENGVHDDDSPQLPRAPPPASAFSDARPSPSANYIHNALLQWLWISIDGVQLPAVLRGGERYLAVHMVQLKLLSKFPSGVPAEILSRYTMISHRMTLTEAWVFNSVNAVLRKFDLGCQIFTIHDEVVLLQDVQAFYWNVKIFNLNRILQQYEAELQKTNSNMTLMSVITALKSQVSNDLEEVLADVRRMSEPIELANTLQGSSSANSPHPQQNGTTHSPGSHTVQSPHSTVSDSKIDVFS